MFYLLTNASHRTKLIRASPDLHRRGVTLWSKYSPIHRGAASTVLLAGIGVEVMQIGTWLLTSNQDTEFERYLAILSALDFRIPQDQLKGREVALALQQFVEVTGRVI